MLRKLPNERGLVGGEIAGNDVDLPAERAQGNDSLEKGDEVLSGVACGSLSMNPPVAVIDAVEPAWPDASFNPATGKAL